MTFILKRLAILFLAATLAACAANQFSETRTVGDSVVLRHARIYIYSFLDAREVEFGPNLLGELDTQLVSELEKNDIKGKILRFRDSNIGQYYSMTNAGMQIPVGQVVARNLNAEREFDAKYRLIIFPSKMTISGAWKFYDVQWDLFDTQTRKKVWSTTSHGKHINMWKNDEDPHVRAKTIVDGILMELRKSNLL
jgi:hypothetical protein